MARARAGRYPGFKAECRAIEYDAWDGVRVWCQHHGCYLLKCTTCGRTFHAVRPHTKHCSTACSQYAYRQRNKRDEVSA